MNHADAERASRFFDRYAPDFSSIYGNDNGLLTTIINRTLRRSMAERFELSIRGCNPITGLSVLDVGCGPGHYSVELARRGAGRVVGIDVAPGMLEIARERARLNSVEEVCAFQSCDFTAWPERERFDYVIVMGFMDYVRDARGVVGKVLASARRRAFLSFPLEGGLLAWQRKARYRRRCELFLYKPAQVRALFHSFAGVNVEMRPTHRDLFVTVDVVQQ